MEYDKVDDFITGNETPTPAVGKYFKIDVPNYNNASGTAEQRRSYIRLGALSGEWQNEPGGDLVKYAYEVGPAGKEVDAAVTADIKARFNITDPEAEFYNPFIDDQRLRGAGNVNPTGPNGHGMTVPQRRAESALLHTKGGWRDHSDGNRITTTRGDKIEVIYGNYKLIVLGRQPDAGQGMGWEATGNNVQDFAGATMPGASVTVSWIKEAYLAGHADATGRAQAKAALEAELARNTTRIGEINAKLPTASTARGRGGKSEKERLQDEKASLEARNAALSGSLIPEAQRDIEDAEEFNQSYVPAGAEKGGGAWLLQNSTERVYQYSRNAGNFKNEEWGDLRESYTGSENPERVGTTRDAGLQGHATTHTTDPSPEVADVPMPGVSSVGLPRGNPRMISKTWAEKIETYTGSSAWKIPEIKEETWVTTKRSETHAKDTHEETHVSGTIDEKTFAGAMTEVVMAATIDSTINSTLIIENTNVLANHTEIFVGPSHISFELTGILLDVFIGIRKVEIEIAKKGYSMSLGERSEYRTKEQKAALDSFKAALKNSQATVDNKKVSVYDDTKALQAAISALSVHLGILTRSPGGRRASPC
jgi:hypothetical protein